MKIKTAVLLMVLILGVSALFLSILMGIGFAQRDPAEIVVNQTVCQHLKLKTTVFESQGSCSLRVDDYARSKGLTELYWLDKEMFPSVRSVTIRNSDLLFADPLPKLPMPIWLYLALLVSMLMTILPLVLLTRSLKERAGS